MVCGPYLGNNMKTMTNTMAVMPMYSKRRSAMDFQLTMGFCVLEFKLNRQFDMFYWIV